jgi:hypothetical protein
MLLFEARAGDSRLIGKRFKKDRIEASAVINYKDAISF